MMKERMFKMSEQNKTGVLDMWAQQEVKPLNITYQSVTTVGDTSTEINIEGHVDDVIKVINTLEKSNEVKVNDTINITHHGSIKASAIKI